MSNDNSLTIKEYIRMEMRAVREDVADIKSDVKGLRDDFMTMEKGRLTAVERKQADFESKIKAYGSAIGFVVVVLQMYLSFIK
jgi:hypothetical protein